jgi:hypothetical protein
MPRSNAGNSKPATTEIKGGSGVCRGSENAENAEMRGVRLERMWALILQRLSSILIAECGD